MTEIVILGGGYAGVHAAKKFYKAFKKNQDVSITLIDKNHHHTLMTELHEIAGDRVPDDSVRVSFERIFAGTDINIIQDEIIELDSSSKKLKSSTGEYNYDYLLMCTGGDSADFGIPGVREHSLPLWSFNNAVHIREHVQEMFYKAAHEKDAEQRKVYLTFVVAGSGFTGIEMLGELIENIPLLAEEYKIDADEVQLINVEGLGTILNMIPEKPRAKAQRYLEKKGVKIMLNSLIVKAEKESFTLKDGTRIKCGTLIWTCGIKGGSFGKTSKLTIGPVDRLKVDKTMKCPDCECIYIAGDAMWFIENERPVPQIVEAAEQTAAVAVHNIIRKITGKGEEKEFKSDFHGFMVSIGGRYAVSYTGGIALSGMPAMALKHLVNVYYLHTLAGVNAWWKYLEHEIFNIKNKRSFLGGLVAGKINGLWALPIRLWLGLMWVTEGINKVGEGWFNFEKGSSSTWMFSTGILQAGMTASSVDAETAASEAEEAAEAVAETVSHVWEPFWDLTAPILSWDNPLVTFFRQTFMDGMAAYIPFSIFQVMVVVVEVALGLALMGGLFTFPAAGVSLLMCLVFILSGLFSWNQLWFIFAGILLLGGAGRNTGLDYWVMPWLKGWWNGTSLAQKSYLYTGEPKIRRKRK